MDISQLQLSSLGPVVDAVTPELLGAEQISIFGRAKNFARLRTATKLRRLWVSGFNAETAGVVAEIGCVRSLIIHDFRVPDLASLAQLASLTELSIAGSAKLKSLSGVSNFRQLRRLILFDSCNYPDVEELAHLRELETLCLEGGFSKQLRLPSLTPLQPLENLRQLRLASLRVTDGSLRPLHGLSLLRETFIARAFSAEEFRALAKALPHARGEFLDSFRVAG